jgi:hypothetical protein
LTTGRRDENVLTTGRRDENVLTTGRRDGTFLTTGRRDGNFLTTGRRDENDLSPTSSLQRRDESGHVKADSTQLETQIQTQNYFKSSLMSSAYKHPCMYNSEADPQMRNIDSYSEDFHEIGQNSDADGHKHLRRTFGVSIDRNVDVSVRGKESPVARKLYSSIW